MGYKTMLQKIKYRDVAKFAWHYWRKQPKMGLSLVTLMAGATVIDTFVPVYTGKIVDILVQFSPDDPGAMDQAITYLLIFVAIGFAFNVLRWGAIALWAAFAVRMLYEILTDAMRKVQRFSSDWHANAFAGATVRKITRGMWSFDLFGDTLFMGLMPALIIMVAMTAMLIAKIPLVGFFVAGMVVLYCGVSIWISLRILAPKFSRSAAADTKVGAVLADIVTGNPTVKAFGAERREDAHFDETATDWRDISRNAWLTGEHTNLLRGMLRMTMLGGMIGLTVWLWQHGQATPGDIALSLTSFFIIGGYLRDVGMHIANLQKSISEMEDVISFWLREDEVQDATDAKALNINRDNGNQAGEIVFDKVRFTYGNANVPIYDDFNIRIAPGEKVALVGHSGSGKSTFVKLVQRLYDVNNGEVRIDGQNIAKVTQESLRQGIALVPQEPILFHRTLTENIAYGKPDASMDEIIAAAKKAYAHDFIQNLPKGYETLVGERGVKLSGGERQRVAIARAILADAPILILDEATSSLDSVSEHYIQQALEELMEGRTTITIAHRLSTIQKVDRILVFDKGQVVEQGRHEELVTWDNSVYRRLYEMQAMDLIGDKSLSGKAREAAE